MVKKNLCFDLDNVICKTVDKNYKESKPIKKSIKLINELYDEGHNIIVFTARGMGKFKGNIKLIEKNYKKLSISQLKKWNLKYHNIFFGKPSYDIFVDDLAFGFKKNWQTNFKKLLK